MTKILKRPSSVLLAVMMIAGIFAVVPISASAAAVTPKYKITVNNKAVVNSTALPYTTSATNLKNKAGYSSYTVTYLKVYKAKDNIGTISGQNFTVNKSGSEQLDIGLKKGSSSGHITPNVVCTPLTPCVCEATGYTGNYDGEPHTIEGFTVTSPESGATVKYGTASGTYNLTAPPSFTDVGTHTVYYQVSAPGWVTKTGSLNVNILSSGYTVTWKNGETTLETDTNVAKDATPEYNGATPTKDFDGKYYYDFKGWTPEITAVTGDATYTAVFEKADINYGEDNKISQDGTVDVSDSDEGKTKFGLDLDNYLNMQMLGVQKKSAIPTAEGDNGIRFVTAVNTNLLKGSKIDDYGYIVVKAVDGTKTTKIYDKMNNLTYGAVNENVNVFSCKGKSNTISGDFGLYDADTDYKYITLAITGTDGVDATLAARFYIKTTDGKFYYADYIDDNNATHGGMAFKLSDVIENLG